MKRIPPARDQGLSKKLRFFPYFRKMPPQRLEEIAQIFRERFFPKGSIILKEKGRARHLFILSQGAVALSIRRGEEELVTEVIKKRGNLFGWSALVSPKRYTATAKALEDTRVFCADGTDLESIFQRYPSFGLTFLKKLATLIATRLYHTHALLADSLS
jgi:CRP-like cAMP-binding protein